MSTIYDVAKKAGVSVATVSRVINGVDHPIREITRKRVLNAIKQLDYHPSNIAKCLAIGKTYTIALLVPNITNDFYTQIAEIIEDRLNEKGYITFLCNTKRSIEKETQYVRSLIERRVDGVVFCPTRVKPEDNQINRDNIIEIRKNNIPIVAFGSHFDGVNQVSVDTYNGALSATEYLISLGHRRIGFIDGLLAGTRANRRKGYIEAINRAGIKLDNNLILSGNLEMDGGYSCTTKLLELDDRPTAIITVSNFMAIGVLKAAKQKGLSVPRDLSVIGFDDSVLSEVVEPSLTVVKQPLEIIGDTATDLLIKELNGNKDVKTIKLNPKLIIRGSCGSI